MATPRSREIQLDKLVATGRVRVVNDGVMGGLSEGRVALTSQGSVVFDGVLSLENRGGFASVRTHPHDFSLAGAWGILIRVRGDGRTYRVRVRTDDRYDGVAYQADFETEKDSWIEVALPFERFQASFRGQEVPGAPELEPGRIRQIGFMVADGKQGSFRLEIEWIRAGEGS